MRHSCRISIGLLLLVLCGQYAAAKQPAGNHGVPDDMLQLLLSEYQRMRTELGNNRYIGLLNYSQPSWEPRFYLINLEQARIVAAYRVAHGKGSDPDHDGFVEVLGDDKGSHMSSAGFFRTGQSYLSGQDGHGLSLRLEGLSDTNRNAHERDIVIHANHYMEQNFINTYGVPGRSHGCLVFSASDRDEIIDKLKGGALIYAVR